MCVRVCVCVCVCVYRRGPKRECAQFLDLRKADIMMKFYGAKYRKIEDNEFRLILSR